MTDHGTVSGYRGHWKGGTPTCQPCKDAQAAWQRTYEIRRYVNRGPLLVDSTGTIRRVQALVALGWPMAVLGERRGVTGRNLHRLLSQTRVHRDTAANIAALYDELSMTIGPSRRSRSLARNNGWVVPLAWSDDKIDDPAARPSKMVIHHHTAIDEIAVQRASRGERVRLSRAERAEVVRRLTAAGLSAADIADRLGIAQRSVSRLRKAA
jgi:DNA-binding CsgD family transcriptional regulator